MLSKQDATFNYIVYEKTHDTRDQISCALKYYKK